MLDIKLIRENPEHVRTNLAKRNNPDCLKMLDDLIALDKDWRSNNTKLNDLRHERKQVTIEIAKAEKGLPKRRRIIRQSSRSRPENRCRGETGG